jgi:hypothetical protein
MKVRSEAWLLPNGEVVVKVSQGGDLVGVATFNLEQFAEFFCGLLMAKDNMAAANLSPG